MNGKKPLMLHTSLMPKRERDDVSEGLSLWATTCWAFGGWGWCLFLGREDGADGWMDWGCAGGKGKAGEGGGFMLMLCWWGALLGEGLKSMEFGVKTVRVWI